MSEISAALAAKTAMTRQNVAISVIKQNADMKAAIANILAESAASVPVSGSRGANVNISA